MATATIRDLRKQDQMRTLWTPYWLTSAEIVGVGSEDLACVCFSFPATKYGTRRLKILECAFQVTTLFAGGTITVNVGSYTLATDAVTTAGLATLVDVDEYVATAHITSGTVGLYWCGGSDWLTASLLGTNAGVEIITPADTTVPCVAVTTTSDATITAGIGRVLMQVVEIPML